MAGFYPDVPANRFALHLDGTQAYTIDSTNNITSITSQLPTLVNDEDDDTSTTFRSKTAVVFIFPELRDIAGYYYNDSESGQGSMQVSNDTTNGLDGTWTTIANPFLNHNTNVTPGYRTAIRTVTAGGVKAVKFNFGAYGYRDARAVHLYGTIPEAQNPDRLVFWEPVNNNPTPGAWFDWGDIQQGTSATKQFRIKNNSSTLTANDVTLSSGAVTHSMSLEFSTDGTTYSASPNVGNIAPGATSSILYVRRNVPSSEPMRPQACTISASAASWS